MKKAIVLAGVFSVIGLGALSLDARSAAAQTPEQAQQGNAAALNKQDADFFDEVAQDNLYELKAAQMAQKQAGSEDVRKYAQRLIDDHTKLQQQLTQLAQKKGLTVPQVLDKKHQDALDKLAKEPAGAKFDKEYMSRMVDDHKDDLSKFNKAAKDAKDADIKNLATSTLPTLQTHETQAKQIEEHVKK